MMAREMKNSGVQWIGDIPSNWIIVQLKRYVTIYSGREISHEIDPDTPNAIPVYGSGGIFKYTDKFQYDGEVVMFGRKGTIGKPLYVKGKFWAVDTMYFLEHNKYFLYPKFNYYMLNAFDWTPYTTNTALPSVVANEVVSCVFPLPPLPEQKAIADFLDVKCSEIDGLLEDLDNEVKILSEYKKSIIAETVTRGLNPNVPMKPSGIPWADTIPAHWEVARTKNVLSTGKILVGNKSANTQLLSLTTKGIKAIEIGSTSGKVPDSYDTYQIVHKNDLVFCLFDLDCSAVFSGYSNYEGMISPAYRVLKTLDGYYSKFYGYWFDYIFDGRKYRHLAKNVRYSLGYDEFAALRIVAPPIEEQEAIANYLDEKCAAIEQSITDKQAQIETLKAYKSSLIYEYVTGKKQVAK